MSWCWGNGIAGEQAERRRVVRPRQDIGSWSGADSHIWLEGPRVCRLSPLEEGGFEPLVPPARRVEPRGAAAWLASAGAVSERELRHASLL
jgi:hypothetical protein